MSFHQICSPSGSALTNLLCGDYSQKNVRNNKQSSKSLRLSLIEAKPICDRQQLDDDGTMHNNNAWHQNNDDDEIILSAIITHQHYDNDYDNDNDNSYPSTHPQPTVLAT